MQIKQLYVHTTSAHRRGAGFFIPMLLAHVFHKHRQVSRLYKSHKSLWSDPFHTTCCVSGFNYIVYVHRLLYRNEAIMFTISWNPEETDVLFISLHQEGESYQNHVAPESSSSPR